MESSHACKCQFKIELYCTLCNNFGANYLVMNKILSIIGRKKRIAGKKNRWEKKQNRLIPSSKPHYVRFGFPLSWSTNNVHITILLKPIERLVSYSIFNAPCKISHTFCNLFLILSALTSQKWWWRFCGHLRRNERVIEHAANYSQLSYLAPGTSLFEKLPYGGVTIH